MAARLEYPWYEDWPVVGEDLNGSLVPVKTGGLRLIYIGDDLANSVYIGDDPVNRVYVGTELVYEA